METKVFTKDGAELKGITSIDLHISNASPIVTATIEIMSLLDTSAEPRFVVADPRDGFIRKVSRIVFADGTDDWTAEEKANG